MSTLTLVLFSILVNIIFFVLHCFVWRFKKNNSPKLILLSIIFIVTYSMLCLLFFHFFNMNVNNHFWLTAPTSVCIFILYLHFYIGMLKSVSLRIMSEIIVRNEMKINISELKKIYSFEKMVEPRLNLLVANKWLKIKNNKYYCTKLSRYIALINLFFHKLFCLKITG